ncbi:MAG: BON domain-containing protein [Pseudomonadales bacterium]|nr:BON domain-containing protein [Pseudomonadales bacterium]
MPNLTSNIARTLALILLIFISACSAYNGNQPDKRTPGALVDDQFIETIGKKKIRQADLRFTSAHIGIISMNGVVLLVGQVESEDLLPIAQSVMEGISKVRSIHNELSVAGPLSMLARSNDALLTSKVKAKLVANDRINSNRVKIATEDSIVYLMGRISREKADIVVNITRKTSGVKKVVKVFEYL